MVQIVYIEGDVRRELDVRVNNPSATVGDLARALDPRGDRTLLVGDRPVDADFDLAEAGVHEGAEVRFAGRGSPAGLGFGASTGPTAAGVHRPTGPPGSIGVAALELVVVNGLDAGRRFALGAGTTVIGRAPDCDIELADTTLSRRHAALTLAPGPAAVAGAPSTAGTLTVADLGSHNGTWVAGEPVVDPVTVGVGVPVRLGALELEVRSVVDADRPLAFDPMRQTSAAGTIPFNRPPRQAPPAPPGVVTMPAPPKPGAGKVPLSVIGIVTPLLFAGLMFAVLREPTMLLFAGLSPVMGIANAIDSKRKGTRSERGEREHFAQELASFEQRLAAAADAERRQREAAHPDPAEIVRRVMLPSVTLWERRPGHHDFLRLRAGIGDVPWQPPVDQPPVMGERPGELADAVARHAVLAGGPVVVDLSAGGVVGIVGDRHAALALARSLLCQAATLHGPADLPVMILARPETAADWDWAKWLPHTRDATGAGRLLSGDPDMSTRLVESRLKAVDPRERDRRAPGSGPPVGPTLLVVADDETLTAGRRAPTRSLLRGDGGLVAGVVIASTVDRLPAVCTAVVDITDPSGTADLLLPQAGQRIAGFAAAGMADDTARGCARALARFEDPELDVVGAGLPASIRLLPLLGLDDCSPEAVLARWKAGGSDPRPATPVGVAEDGVFGIDFVADGPHGLVGGTTGAGKSELLRSLVAGLAASVDPDHLTFVLVDFKGGSAFDECARLPHTVGMVTDLDEHLAARALRCLEAELKHRERTLRDVGATDLTDYLRRGLPEPMPRLLVIIDEFATLKAELPQFIDSLVGVAQRGRSLGVHMLLATQRPQGAINDNIRANTNIRIALRVQEPSESSDIIDVPDAAAIPRTAPGRAYVRLGPGEVVAIQSALSTGERSESTVAPVDVAPFVYGPQPRVPAPSPRVPPGSSWAGSTSPEPRAGSSSPSSGVGPGAEVGATTGASADGVEGRDEPETDLSVLVAAIRDAFARTGRPLPRRPWPDPLPLDVDLDAVVDAAAAVDPDVDARADVAAGFTVPFALADDPEAQTQYPVGWSPAEGNLILYGLGGSGTTTGLTSVALSLARLRSPDDLHLYALDFGAGGLAALATLPHAGAVLTAGERERQVRLMRQLRSELDRRRAMGVAAARAEPTIVTLVDGWSAFAAEYNDLASSAVWDGFTRVLADGPEVGLLTVIAADRANAVPAAIAALVQQRFVLRLSTTGDYTAFGLRPTDVPEMVPGRAVVTATGQEVQIARPADGVAGAAVRIAAAHPAPTRPAVGVEPLGTELALSALSARAQLDARPWFVPVGVAEADRAAAGLTAYQGEHALVTGPARSGKSTTLLTVAAACRAAHPHITVVAVAGPRSPLAAVPAAGDVPVGGDMPVADGLVTDGLVDRVVAPADIGQHLGPLVDAVDGRVLVLVDDAESLEDTGGVLERLSTSDRSDLLFVAAGRNDGIRAGYSHWTRAMRRSKLGVLLRPNVDLDGDILGAQVPRRAPVAMLTGRGYLACGGEAELVQIVLPR